MSQHEKIEVRSYVKQPVVIQAMKFVYSEAGIAALKEFCGPALLQTSKARTPDAVGEAIIKTLEDGSQNQARHVATEGDYVIKGVAGEFYPCKPDIFHKTYKLY